MLGFVGPFGDSNYGDYAMFVNDIHSLNQNEAIVFSYNTKLISTLKDKYLKGINVNCCQINIDYSYEEKFTNNYHVEFDTRAYTPIEIINRVENLGDLRKKISQIDALIVCGGGYFNHIWNAKHRKAKLFSILAAIYVAAEQKKCIYFMGNTFGPFCDSKIFFETFFDSVPKELVTYAVRDTLSSVKELSRIGIEGNVVVVPDDLYFLDESIKKENYSDKSKVEGKYIIWECYASINEIKNNSDIIKFFSEEMKKRYGLQIVFVPLDKRFGGEYQGQLICEMNPEIVFYNTKKEIIEIAELNQLVNNAEFVIGHRYHLFLTALANNTPCVSVLKEVSGDYRYYYCKVKGLLDQVFENQVIFEENFIKIDMWKTLRDVVENYERIISAQKEVFNDKKSWSENKMKEKRNCYLKCIINGKR